MSDSEMQQSAVPDSILRKLKEFVPSYMLTVKRNDGSLQVLVDARDETDFTALRAKTVMFCKASQTAELENFLEAYCGSFFPMDDDEEDEDDT